MNRLHNLIVLIYICTFNCTYSVYDIAQLHMLDSSIEKEFNTQEYVAQFTKAEILYNQSKFDEATYLYRRLLKKIPTSASIHYNLGLSLSAQDNEQEASKEFEKVVILNPAHSKARLHLVEYLKKHNKLKEAVELCLIGISYSPEEFEYKTAQLNFSQGNLDDAIIHFRKALLYCPNNGQILMEYANTLNLHYSYECALEIYHAMYELGIKSNGVLFNIAYTLKRMNRIQEAIKICQEIITQTPSYAQAHFTLATSYLALGNYANGWKEYEWRWKQKNVRERKFKQPLWNGKSLKGKKIVLHAEQGLGDTFQFIRYAKIAKEKGGYVIAAVQSPLTKILSLCPYIDEITTLNSLPQHFDTQAALLTLPYLLKTEEQTIPSEPYLYADPNLILLWKETLEYDKNFKIGVCWQGNPNYSTHFLRLAVAHKSIRPALFAPIAALPGISLYSLQKDHAPHVDESLPEGCIIHNLDEHFDVEHGRFMDTAALMKNLDLVITVDTSIAHLAGGLGIPVWVLLPLQADWRWLINRSDNPWYPTMRLFRQTMVNEWTMVIDDVCNALLPLLEDHSQRNMAK